MKRCFYFIFFLMLLCLSCKEQKNRFSVIEVPVLFTETEMIVLKDSIVNDTVFSSDTLKVWHADLLGRMKGYQAYINGSIYLQIDYNYTDSSCIIDCDWDVDTIKANYVTRTEYYKHDRGFKRIIITHPNDTNSIIDFTLDENANITRIKGVHYYETRIVEVDEFYEYDKHGNVQRWGMNPNLQNNTSVKRHLPENENYVNTYRGDTLIKQEMRIAGRTEQITTYEYSGDSLIESLFNRYGRLTQKTFTSLTESFVNSYSSYPRTYKIEYYKNGFFIGRERYLVEQLRHDP